MKKKLFVIGTPSEFGGANSEALHSIILWRRYGVNINVVPTWSIPSDIAEKLISLGIKLISINQNEFNAIADLQDSVVVSFCNQAFMENMEIFKGLNCKIIWLGCMNKLMSYEVNAFQKGLFPDLFIFQSNFQKQKIKNELKSFNYELDDSFPVIHGAFIEDLFQFRPRPHFNGQPFYVGRAARPAISKWRPDLFYLLSQVKYSLLGIFLGIDNVVRARFGFQPIWTACLRPASIDLRIFYSMLHCFLAINSSAKENWPRVGLEAMASGVPIVARTDGDGWNEMIEHEKTGFLCDSDSKFISTIEKLANDESLRNTIIHNAKQSLKSLVNPEMIWSQWKKVFEQFDVL